MLTFRPFNFSDQDYATALSLHNAVWIDNPQDERDWRREDSIRPKTRYHKRIIAEINGTPVGYGEFSEKWYFEKPNYYGLSWLTSAEYRKQGICTAFYKYALAQMQADGCTIGTLRSGTHENQPAGLRWLTKHGFAQIDRYPISELKLADFAANQFAGYAARIAAHGLTIKPLAEIIPHDPNWQRKLYDLEWIFEQDEPGSNVPKQTPFEQHVKETFEDDDFSPQMWFIALDGDRYAGMSCLWPNKAKPHELATGWTGVDRPYRKKGLAMAMKLAAIAYAQQQPAITHIETDNHETNWMYQINLHLGFTPKPAWRVYDKVLAEAESRI